MSMPLITVIVPVYKVEPYLKRCVDSIRKQTYTNLEIILIDDGSPDHCGEMCDQMAVEDPRIRVIHQENQGLSAARNAGLDIMTGEYVGFVDSDDWIDVHMYETLYRNLVETGAQISCCSYTIVNEAGSIFSKVSSVTNQRIILKHFEAMRDILVGNSIGYMMWNKLYSRDIFYALRMKNGIIYEDAQIQLWCFHTAQQIVYTNQALYYYFLSPQSITRGAFSVRHYDRIVICKEIIQFCNTYYVELLPYAEAAYIRICMAWLYRGRNCADWIPYRSELIRTIRHASKDCIRLLSLKDKIKRMLFHFHPRVFYLVINLYRKIRKIPG